MKRTTLWIVAFLTSVLLATTPTMAATGPVFNLSAQPITIAASGSAQTLTPSINKDTVYNVTLTGNTAFTAAGGVTSGAEQTIRVYLSQDATAGRLPTFSNNVVWQNNAAPTFNTASGYYDIVQLTTLNGGTTYSGLLVGSQLPSPALPGVPTGVAASAGSTLAVISANPLVSFPAITGYTIYRGTTPGGESGTPIATNVALPYTDTGLANGTTYYYKVAGVNSLGTGGQSAEASVTPSTTAYGHYAAFNGSNGFIFTGYNAAYNPGANPFSIQAFFSPTTATPATFYAIFGQWVNATSTNSAFLFYLDATGKLAGTWYNTVPTRATCLSSTTPGFDITNHVPLWIRIDIVPTTGSCTFYVGGSAATPVWNQLGSVISAGVSGAVQSVSTTTLVIGQTYGSGGTGGQVSGNFYQATLTINGVPIMNPTAGASATNDPVGLYTFTTSPSNVTYN